MRTAVLLGRVFIHARSPLLSRFALRAFRPPCLRRISPKGKGPAGTMLMATMTPAAFLQLAEEGDGGRKTGEKLMLEESRNEVRKSVAEDARGVSRLRQSLSVFWTCYVYDPIATGVRFAHLAFIFLPVILTAPAVWLGRKVKDRNGLRTGTLWWYGFLVQAMERAGPAFIKVLAAFG